MRTTAILNLKGGVGKTATTVNMAAILAADYHKRVLVVDADSQANTTEFFGGVPKTGVTCTLSDLLRRDYCNICDTNVENVRMIAADENLMDLDLSAVKSDSVRIDCLQNVARGGFWEKHFDYMLIDCPPAFNAACQIQNMRAINPGLKLAGLLPTMIYKSEKISAALETLRASDLFVFPGIRKTNKVDDMTFAQRPLIESSPKSAACIDYRKFVGAYVAQEGGKDRGKSTTRRRRTHGTMKGGANNG